MYRSSGAGFIALLLLPVVVTNPLPMVILSTSSGLVPNRCNDYLTTQPFCNIYLGVTLGYLLLLGIVLHFEVDYFLFFLSICISCERRG